MEEVESHRINIKGLVHAIAIRHAVRQGPNVIFVEMPITPVETNVLVDTHASQEEISQKRKK